mmetsp:Transcript_34047/g.88038  ORF Transcript_34047/g.88038 Transcript_34047/m.88038 type:complete len:239 (-) Transcript_34047:14-730(-)
MRPVLRRSSKRFCWRICQGSSHRRTPTSPSERRWRCTSRRARGARRTRARWRWVVSFLRSPCCRWRPARRRRCPCRPAWTSMSPSSRLRRLRWHPSHPCVRTRRIRTHWRPHTRTTWDSLRRRKHLMRPPPRRPAPSTPRCSTWEAPRTGRALPRARALLAAPLAPLVRRPPRSWTLWSRCGRSWQPLAPVPPPPSTRSSARMFGPPRRPRPPPPPALRQPGLEGRTATRRRKIRIRT